MIAPRRPTDELLQEVMASGGELAISADRASTIRPLIASARRFNKVPEGKLLLLESVERPPRGYVLRLVDVAGGAGSPDQPVAVPQQLRRPSPIAVELRDSGRAFDLDREVRTRGLRLLQALITALGSKGVECRPGANRVEARQRYVEWAHLEVLVPGTVVGLRLEQVIDRKLHVATAAEQRALAERSWTYVPRYDETRTDRLRLRLTGYGEYHRSIWADTAKGPIEGRLGEVIFELFARSVIGVRLNAEREAAERRRAERYEQALRQARVELHEVHRLEVLEQQVKDWRRAAELRRYVEAMTAVVEQMPGDERLAAEAWRSWVAQHADQTDPLLHEIRMPAEKEIGLYALQQHVARTTGLHPG